MATLSLTFAEVRRADDDQVGDEGGEARGQAGLSDEPELQLVQADGLKGGGRKEKFHETCFPIVLV